MEIKIRPLIKVLNKIIKIPKGNYLDPTTLGSGIPDSTKFLAGDSSWVSSPVPTPLGYYGAFQDNTTQTLAAINTPTPMKLDTVDLSNQVTVENNLTGDPTRITVAHTGIYNIQWSGEFMNSTNTIHDVNVWIRINGTDVTGSNGIVAVPARKSASAGEEGQSIQGWNYLLSLNGGDYVEFIWMSEDLGVTLHYFSGGYPPPSTASVIVTVTQQSGIMAGTGMTALNGLNSDVQLLSVGTAGTDFNISSVTDTHTFNLPTASATNRGALKKADWTTFNNKQNAITLTTTGTGAATFVADVLNIPTPSAGGGSGIFGISNSSGVYTYYATFTLAMAAATSGQTIEMFADVVETGAVTITLKNGVNINGNGHTYTLNNSGLIHALLTTASVATNCNILNLNVIRTGSTGIIADNSCLILSASGSGIINCTGSTFRNSGSGCGIVFSTNSTHEVNYATAYAISTWGAIGIFSSAGARLNNSIGYATSGGFGIRCHNGGDLQNCIGTSDSSYGIYGGAGNQSNSTGLSITGTGFGGNDRCSNCTGKSVSGVGFEAVNGSVILNCIGLSISGRGFTSQNANTYNCSGSSSSSSGVSLGGTSRAYNITAISSGSYSLWATVSASQIYGGNITCNWNNAAGYGIRGNGGAIASVIINCIINLSNASAPYLFNDVAAQAISMRGNTYKGGAVFNANLTQAIVTVEDAQGNIYL